MEKTALINDVLKAACLSLQQTTWHLRVDRGQYVSHLGALQLALCDNDETMVQLMPRTFAPAALFDDMPPLTARDVATKKDLVFDAYDQHLRRVPVTVTAHYDPDIIPVYLRFKKQPMRSKKKLLAACNPMPIRLTVKTTLFEAASQPWPLKALITPTKLAACVSTCLNNTAP